MSAFPCHPHIVEAYANEIGVPSKTLQNPDRRIPIALPRLVWSLRRPHQEHQEPMFSLKQHSELIVPGISELESPISLVEDENCSTESNMDTEENASILTNMEDKLGGC